MTAGGPTAIFSAIKRVGGRAYFVGGAVRDWLLGRDVGDIDLATSLVPDALIDALEAADIRALPTGLDHGTVTAVIEGRAYEITTLRRDVTTDGRHAVVAFTTSIREDAERRDLTMNALYADPSGAVFDPIGGLPDLDAGRVRFIGTASDRIREDCLRILRFFRFLAHYGQVLPDPGDLSACAALAFGINRLSGERVAAETKRLLAAPDPVPTLRLMAVHGVLDHVLPSASRHVEDLARVLTIEPRTSSATRLGALIRDPGAAAALAERLKLSNAETTRLIAAQRVAQDPPAIPGPAINLIRRLGRDPVLDGALIARARGRGDMAALIELVRAWDDRPFPINGGDLIARGFLPGPELGAILRVVEAWWEQGGAKADRAACLAELDRVLKSRG